MFRLAFGAGRIRPRACPSCKRAARDPVRPVPAPQQEQRDRGAPHGTAVDKQMLRPEFIPFTSPGQAVVCRSSLAADTRHTLDPDEKSLGADGLILVGATRMSSTAACSSAVRKRTRYADCRLRRNANRRRFSFKDAYSKGKALAAIRLQRMTVCAHRSKAQAVLRAWFRCALIAHGISRSHNLLKIIALQVGIITACLPATTQCKQSILIITRSRW